MGLSLVTLAEVKAYAGISSTTQDDQLNSIIPQVSNFIKQYCNRTFIDWVDDDKVEIFNGGNSIYYLKEAPTIELKSVELSADFGQTYTTLINYTDYVLDTEYDRLQCVSGDVFPYYLNGYKVTYTAGFEEIPADVKLAAYELIMYYLKSDTAVKSSSNVGRNNAVIEYITNGKLPSSISRLLNFWVQEWS